MPDFFFPEAELFYSTLDFRTVSQDLERAFPVFEMSTFQAFSQNDDL